MPLTSDTVLQNRYRIVGKLSAGGMGTVYEAIDLRFNSQVALKETHFTEEALRKQFEREAHLLYKLRHPAIARVIDHFTENDGQFLVMDYVEGEDLWEILEKQGSAFPVDEVLKWADQLLDALDYLHSQEPPIIHRDIKPQNLKLTVRNQIILLDFGLAKGFAGQISRVTTSGSIFGYTPNYAPLEQIQGTGTGAYSDLYSLGATLYHLMTGVVPPDVLSRLTATSEGQPDPLHLSNDVNPQVSSGLANVINKAMAVARTQRFASAAEMREALHDTNQFPATASNEFKVTVPPPTIFNPVTTEFAQEKYDRSFPPTVAQADSIQKPREQNPTVSAATVVSPTERLPSTPTESTKPSSSLVQPKRNLRWLISITAGVLVLAISLYLFYSYRLRQQGTSEVSSVDLERSITDRQLFLLNLKNAFMKLDNEARARGRRIDGETKETRPVFDSPLDKARDEAKQFLQRLAMPPYSESEKWRNITGQLDSYIQATQDPAKYLREGYVVFRTLDKSIDELINETNRERDAIPK